MNALNVVDIKPVTMFHIKNIHSGKIQKKPFKVLLDTGSEKSVIKHIHSHHGKVSKGHAITFRTPSGTFQSKDAVDVDFTLSEFSESRRVRWKFHVLPESSRLPYDMIIGRDLMRNLKMDVLYSDSVVTWDELKLPMHKVQANGKGHDFNALVEDQAESKSIKDSMTRLTRILDANYDTSDLVAEGANMKHLDANQRSLMLALLKRNESLFDGQLGNWVGSLVEIPLMEGAKPYHVRAFPIPNIYEQTFKKDLDRLVSIGVLRKVNCSEWAAPAFIIAKKDIRVRFISDFRKMNSQIKRAPYPLPHIKYMLLKVRNFKYETALDLVMGYYNIKLSDESRKI